MQREAKRQMQKTGIGTKSQQALKLQQEQYKQKRKIRSKEKKEEKTVCFPYDDAHFVRPKELKCDVVRFQNAKDKWIAFIGKIDDRPYEIFTGLSDDEDGILLPRSVVNGKIIKSIAPDGTKRYDFQYTNKHGYRTTIEGLSYKFNPVFHAAKRHNRFADRF